MSSDYLLWNIRLWEKHFSLTLLHLHYFLLKWHLSDLYLKLQSDLLGFALNNCNTFLCWQNIYSLSPVAGRHRIDRLTLRESSAGVKLKHVATRPPLPPGAPILWLLLHLHKLLQKAVSLFHNHTWQLDTCWHLSTVYFQCLNFPLF